MTRNQPDMMSISPNGGRIITLIIAVLLFITVWVLSSCGPAYHLQRSKHHLQRAIDKGADVKVNSKTFHFKSPEIKFSTTIKPTWLNGAPIPLWRDTLTAKDEKTGATIKAKIGLKKDCPEDCIKEVYLEADCPPQDVKVDVPCETISAGHTTWDLIIAAIAALAVGYGGRTLHQMIRSRR